MVNEKILLILSAILIVSIFSSPAQALWLSGYEYRKEFAINGSGDGNLTDYQLLLNMYKGSGADSGNSVYLSSVKDDFSDIRFTNSAGTELDYWIESKTDGSNAKVWIEFDSLPQSASTDFYMYYGNDLASAGDDADETFIIYNDFDDETTGSAPADYTIKGNEECFIDETVYQGDSGKSMKFIDDNESDYIFATRSFTPQSKVKFHFWVRAAQTDEYFRIDDGTKFHFVGATNGTFKVRENKLTPLDPETFYTANAWYQIDLYIDADTDTFTVYVDEAEKGTFDFRTVADDLNSIDFRGSYLGNVDQPTFWIDNVWVANYTPNEPTWESWGEEENLIPEPASLLLLGLGVTGLALFRKRKV